MSNQAPPFRPPATKKKRDNTTTCLVVGCALTGAIAILLVIASAVLFTVGMPMLLDYAINEYTTEESLELPIVEIGEKELEELTARVEEFGNAMEAGDPAAPLVLSGDDINAMIQNDPDLSEIGDKVYVMITDDDQITGQVTIPVDELVPDIESAQGRYFNGEATFNVAVVGGMLVVKINSLSINGQTVPEEFMAGMRQENLARDMMNDPDARAAFEKIDDIAVRDGALHIIPKNKLEDAPEEVMEEDAPAEEETVEAEE